jgi:hypothetical protein
VPKGLGLSAGRLGGLLPSLLDFVKLARGLLDLLGFHAFRGVKAELRGQGFGAGDELLLDRGIRETLPLVHLTQFVEFRCNRRL